VLRWLHHHVDDQQVEYGGLHEYHAKTDAKSRMFDITPEATER
jgi:hypothetical protein